MNNIDLINMKNNIVSSFDEVIFNDSCLIQERFKHCLEIVNLCAEELEKEISQWKMEYCVGRVFKAVDIIENE